MKVRISSGELRLRLTYRELEMLGSSPATLDCAGLVYAVEADADAAGSTLSGWPARPVLRLGGRDWRDLAAEPENGIALPTLTPRVVVEVDRRDRP